MKFTKTPFGGPQKQILKFADHYVALPVTVNDSGVSANENGKKIVPAGTVIGGGFIDDKSKFAVKSNDENAEGVLFNDVDVTYGPAAGAALIHAFIETDKLPEAPASEAKAALNQIKFIK